jgi:hypothetical protein
MVIAIWWGHARKARHTFPPMADRLVLRCLAWAAGAAALLALSGCASLKVTDDTPNSVTIRYDGVASSFDDATAAANQACAKYGKTAKLREDDRKAALESYAHFYCVNG